MRFKEYMANQGHTPQSNFLQPGVNPGQTTDDPRYRMAQLRKFNQKKVGDMRMSHMEEDRSTLIKIRKLAMNIITAWKMGFPDKDRYEGVRIVDHGGNDIQNQMIDLAQIGFIVGISEHDIQTGEGGRQFLSSQEVYWGMNQGIFKQTGQSNAQGSTLWDLDVQTLINKLDEYQGMIDQYGSGYGLIQQAIDRVTGDAFKGELGHVTNIIK